MATTKNTLSGWIGLVSVKASTIVTSTTALVITPKSASNSSRCEP